MTEQERQEFLAGVHVGVLAVERPGRAPLAVPIWYDYTPGGEVLLWIDRGSVKERLLREARRFSLNAQVETPPYKYATAEGPIVAIDGAPTEEQALGIAGRYLPADEAAAWVRDNLGDSSLLVRMRPEKWLSTDYAKA
ncbi:pyridoxamine 5'-phosphate oxidase [Pseudonocardia humida]|nr:pyridoxamine 5'-phosphate oxidase [Pseudonocardia humida]